MTLQELFDLAIKEGELVAVTGEDGREYFSFRKVVVGKGHGSKESQDLDLKKKVDAKTAGMLIDLFSSLSWSFKPSQADLKKIEQGELVNSAKKLLTQAISANERLVKDAMKLITKDAQALGDAKLKELKMEHKRSQTNIMDLQHIQNFQEMSVATDAQRLNQCIETGKGMVKAAKN